jgi:hypothetical protein
MHKKLLLLALAFLLAACQSLSGAACLPMRKATMQTLAPRIATTATEAERSFLRMQADPMEAPAAVVDEISTRPSSDPASAPPSSQAAPPPEDPVVPAGQVHPWGVFK